MIGFLVKRLGNYLVLTIVASAFGYVLASLTLNPAARFLGKNPPIPQSTIDAYLRGIGADPNTPLLVRLWDWIVQLVTTGSLGRSFQGTDVTADIIGRAGTSLRLLIIGSLLGAIIGVCLGVWSAVRQYKLSDQVITYASFTILATPVFVLAIVLMILATSVNDAVGAQIFSFTGEYTAGLGGTPWDQFVDRLNHLLLPTIVLAISSAATYSRYQRSAMLDVLSADYIRTARAKGRTRGSALVRHGVRIALIPMSTFFAYSFGLMLTGAAITENVFSWHGMGEYLLISVQNADINAAAGTTLFTAILVLIAGTLADLLYAALDPRVRM